MNSTLDESLLDVFVHEEPAPNLEEVNVLDGVARAHDHLGHLRLGNVVNEDHFVDDEVLNGDVHDVLVVSNDDHELVFEVVDVRVGDIEQNGVVFGGVFMYVDFDLHVTHIEALLLLEIYIVGLTHDGLFLGEFHGANREVFAVYVNTGNEHAFFGQLQVSTHQVVLEPVDLLNRELGIDVFFLLLDDHLLVQLQVNQLVAQQGVFFDDVSEQKGVFSKIRNRVDFLYLYVLPSVGRPDVRLVLQERVFELHIDALYFNTLLVDVVAVYFAQGHFQSVVLVEVYFRRLQRKD